MPGFDGTGPFGDGRPGRGLGPCGRFGRPYGYRYGHGYGYGYGRGRGFGRGMGQGYRRFYQDAPYYYPEETDFIQPYNKESLQARKRELEKELKWLEDEIKELSQENK